MCANPVAERKIPNRGWRYRLDAKPNTIKLAVAFYGTLKGLGLLSGISAALSFVWGYAGTAIEQQLKVSDSLRSIVAIAESKNGQWIGNLGHITAMEYLTSDCGSAFRNVPGLSYFMKNCIPLTSLRLHDMDFGGINLKGANISNGYFYCSNFHGADLRNADLTNANIQASDFSWADLRGAKLTTQDRSDLQIEEVLMGVNLSGAIFDEKTKLDKRSLKWACLKGEPPKYPDQWELAEYMKKLPMCPKGKNICGEVTSNNFRNIMVDGNDGS